MVECVLRCTVVAYAFLLTSQADAQERTGWKMHIIDNSSRGADGVRPQDINGDGRPDLVTGWEEGGQVRVYLHPGTAAVRDQWPAVTVGKVASPEDAVFVDLDGDGMTDVVSSCEGKNCTVHVHWSPLADDKRMESSAWSTGIFPGLAGKQAYMFCLPMQVDNKLGVDLVFGSKVSPSATASSQLGWLQSPQDPRSLSDWVWHPLYDSGWIMSLFAEDMDGDGDTDILLTDRKGTNRGCKWLENPGPVEAAADAVWPPHLMGGADAEVMFADRGDLGGDGQLDVVTATSDGGLIVFRRMDSTGVHWETERIPMPPNAGRGKGVGLGDVDLDGSLDIVVSCEHAEDKHGVFWLRGGDVAGSVAGAEWQFQPISGLQGIKFDLVQLIDLDEDGDLDVQTCEERANLGVIWYENPNR